MLRLVGILSVYAGVSWVATLALVATRGAWRLPPHAPAVRGCAAGVVAGADGARARRCDDAGMAVAGAALLTSATACAVAALLARRVVSWYRHATVAARIFALFLAFLIPALLLYPSLDFFAERAIQRPDRDEYAVEAQNHSEVLRQRLAEAQDEIDALTILPELVAERRRPGGAGSTPTARSWCGGRRSLRRDRLTSAVELYDRAADVSSAASPEPAGVHRQRPAAAGDLRLRLGRLRRAAADRIERASGAPRGARHLPARSDDRQPAVGRHDHRARRVRLPHAAVHHLAEPVLRAVSSDRAGDRRANSRPATISTSRSTAGACSRSTRRACQRGRSPTRCSSASTTPRASRSGRRSARRRSSTGSTSRTIARASTPSATRC